MGWRSHFLIQEGLSPSKFSGFAEDISAFSRVQKGMLECGWIKQPSDCFHYITGSTTGNQLWDRLVLTATTALQETNSPVVQCKRSQCKGITHVIIQYIIHITYHIYVYIYIFIHVRYLHHRIWFILILSKVMISLSPCQTHPETMVDVWDVITMNQGQ